MEETVAGLRLRREPRADVPEEHRMELLALRAQEDRRIANERAGLAPEKTFAEMNLMQLSLAMASYPRGQYPAELERLMGEYLSTPPPKLEAEARDALLEVLSLQEQLRGDEPATWMVERLHEMMSHPSPV